MKKRKVWLIPLTLLCGGASRKRLRSVDVPQSECDALIALYDQTNGPSWTNKTNWLTSPIVGTWFGITVAGGHVTRINLSTNNLVGNVNWSIMNALPSLTHVQFPSNASLSGDISGWVLQNLLETFQISFTAVFGNISGWVLPNSLTYFQANSTAVFGNISGWVLPNSLATFYINSTAVGVDSTFAGIGTGLENLKFNDCNMTAVQVDNIIASIYAARAGFTCIFPTLNVGGSNANSSGTYQAQCPPLTGLEQVYELVNDSCLDGFNKWVITY